MGEYAGPRRLRPFVAYAAARYRRDSDEAAYRTYVTEGIRWLLGGDELPSWAELVCPSRPAERMTGRQLADSVLERLAKLGGEDD